MKKIFMVSFVEGQTSPNSAMSTKVSLIIEKLHYKLIEFCSIIASKYYATVN